MDLDGFRWIWMDLVIFFMVLDYLSMNLDDFFNNLD